MTRAMVPAGDKSLEQEPGGPELTPGTKRLFDAGDKIDKACGSCHLEFWYLGDKKLVLENQGKTVTCDKSTP